MFKLKFLLKCDENQFLSVKHIFATCGEKLKFNSERKEITCAVPSKIDAKQIFDELFEKVTIRKFEMLAYKSKRNDSIVVPNSIVEIYKKDTYKSQITAEKNISCNIETNDMGVKAKIIQKYWGKEIAKINTNALEPKIELSNFLEKIGLAGDHNIKRRDLLVDIICILIENPKLNHRQVLKKVHEGAKIDMLKISKELSEIFLKICSLQPGAKKEYNKLPCSAFVREVSKHYYNCKK